MSRRGGNFCSRRASLNQQQLYCPYALAVWPRLIRLAKYAQVKGIETVAINPNIHPSYPDDSPQNMQVKIAQWAIPFPYLVDEKQEAARAFRAQCTPDLYLFNKDRKLIYHGRIDDNWQDEAKVTHPELKDAIDQHVAGRPVSPNQKSSIGCSIKWRE
jgi:hypothetical protein